jgi:iron complex outermembrane receptor protein
MTYRRLLIGSASLLALFGGSATAFAQDAPTAAATTDADQDILITGIRGSIRTSISAKRDSDVIGDFLSAEDIGQFPDRNVAEALQRVPGILINREFGEGERVSLRGTAPNLTRTLVNGHAIATADWFVLEQLAATRSFNYLTLPSEIVARLDVYKSPQADVDEGGIGGTINVHTRNPLDLDPFTVSASAEMVYSERRDSFDPQASGLLSWHNQDRTFGILIGLVYQRRDIRRDGVEVLGYFNPVDNPATPANEDPSGNALIPSLIGSALFLQERERYGGNIGIQYRPSDALEVNITGLYSRFGADNYNQNYLAWGSQAIGGGGTLSNFTVSNGTVVSGRIDSTPGGRAVVFDAIDRNAFAETWSGDFDLVWHPSDHGQLHFKAGYTEAQGDTVSQPFYEGGAPGGFTFDLTGRTPEVTFIGVDPTDPNDLVFDFGSLHQITNTDRELYFYTDYEHEVDWGPVNAIRVGAKYTDHDRITRFLATTYGGFFLPLLNNGCGGPCTSSDFFAGNLTPGNFLNNIADPGTLTSYWQVDRNLLQNIYNSQPANVRQRVLNPPENYSITERTYGGYAMIRFGGDNWRGNAGVRVIRTDQTSRGNQIGLPPGPGTIDNNPFGVYRPIEVERSYTDILPSINLAFDLAPRLTLRLAAARAMARPDYTDIVPRVNLNPGSLTAAGGDPSVDPYRANQFDASLEWYPDRESIVAGAVYYKDIRSYITDTITQEVFPVQTNTPNLSRCTPTGQAGLFNCTFDVNRRANGPGGRNLGFEIQASRRIWGGFGAVVNYTYSDAKLDGGGQVPGNSRHAFNVSAYYENDTLSARLSYNYRSSFFITVDRAAPLNQASTESLDASLNFRITDNISLTADAINLTNEKIVQFSGTPDRPRAIYDNGRQFYFGVRVRY